MAKAIAKKVNMQWSCRKSLFLSLIILLILTSCSIKLYSIEDEEIIIDGIKYVHYYSTIWEFGSTLKDWTLLGYTK